MPDSVSPIDLDALASRVSQPVDTSKLEQLVRDSEKLRKDEQKELGPATDKLSADIESDQASVKKARESVAPLDVEPWKEKRPDPDPLTAFGSLGGMFAQIASAFTHQPMVNALNAGAAAMNAARSNDLAKYNDAFSAWKDNADLAIKRHQAQHEDYEDALSELNADTAAGAAKLRAVAAKYGDQITAIQAEAGEWDKIISTQNARNNTAIQFAEQLPTLKLKGMQLQALLELQNARDAGDPEGIKKAQQKIQDIQESMATPSAASLTMSLAKMQAISAQLKLQAAQLPEGDPQKASLLKQAADIDQSVVTSKTGPEGQFTDKMGELMAALAEKGVSLPTGFRSKQQQVELFKGLLERNKDKTPEEIADGIKKGQIEFAAQKKETQTAAGIAGKVEVAQNEISQFIPLVRQASALVPRGNFVPMTRLLQTAETAISDPNLKQLKIYINSLLNAYDMLASRGGTDMDKRAQVRSLLTAADSPQALESGLKAFQKEADAAHKAAVEATRVPELEKPGGADDSSPTPGALPPGWKYNGP